MDSRVFPPVDGSVTLPEVVDFHRAHNPYKPIYVFSEDGKPHPTHISYLEFGRAADRVARLLRPRRGGPDGQVIAFVALSDTLLYHAVTLGILRAGFKPYPMSPRNTAAAIIKMMKETSCHRLITTKQTLLPLIKDIESELDSTYSLCIEEVPPLREIFPRLGYEKVEDPFEQYPRGVRLPLDSVSMYIHSSGSTGLPKTIPQTFKSMVHWASFPSVTDCKKPGLIMATMALPAFHTMGIIVQLLIGNYAMQPIGLYPPTATTPNSLPMMPTPANLLDHIVRTKCTGLATIPAFLQVWAQDKDAVRILASLQYVVYSGGSVPSKLGTFMSESGVYLQPVYGATEFGAPSYFFRRQVDEKDWEYLEFPDLINIQWDPQGDGTFELQLQNCETHQLSVTNLPGCTGYASSDLWLPHPTKPNLWKIVGRKDDVIVHTSGEKTVPAPMEDVLMSSPYVMGTVMFGRERDQPGVIIELKPSYSINPTNEDELVKMRNLLWPIVEEANKVAPAFSRIFKEMIVIASPNKPFPRAGKGTIMRKAALSLYADEIDAIYEEVNVTAENDGLAPPSSWDRENTAAWLHDQLQEILSGDKKDLGLSDDFFEKGMDSLSATILRRRVTGALNSTSPKAAQLVSQSTIYAHPSIDKLAAFLVDIVADPDSFVLTSNRTGAMELLINKYSRGLAQPIVSDSHDNARPTADGAVVLLTGSTGNLGAQILESLLRDSRVQRIYALNRPSSGSKSIMDRQIERFNDKALDANLLKSSRLVLLEGEMSHMNLGLQVSMYEELRHSVTTIIHNAWKLDFNLPLSSFEPNIQGTRHLIDLARSSHYASSIKFLFTSSVSSAYSWDMTRGHYPEEIVMDSRYAVSNGYGESKYVTERILSQSGLQATSLRIGQISGGSPNGAWAMNDWVPILVKSSIRLGALPDAIGLTSWLPMNAVSRAILDVAWSPGPSTFALNLVHPRPIPWNLMLSLINEAMVSEGVVGSRIPTVPYQDWYSLLENHVAESSEDVLNDIPAIKLLEFFAANAKADDALRSQEVQTVEAGGLTLFSTTRMRSVSKTVEELSSLDETHASMWIKYWKDSKFF